MVMLQELFGHPVEKGYQLAKQVDIAGRAVVMTTTRERAELKRDQIHAYGKDDLIDGCLGSMKATIEPAE
jgi:ATP-dependent Clp protease adaptor protein ClpS